MKIGGGHKVVGLVGGGSVINRAYPSIVNKQLIQTATKCSKTYFVKGKMIFMFQFVEPIRDGFKKNPLNL